MKDKNRMIPEQQEAIEELSDTQLNEIVGGLEIPVLPTNGSFGGLKLGQALEKNSSFTKSDDRLPSGGV